MEMTIDTSFIERLSDGVPSPGGGSASAYCAALAGACACMAGNLTYKNESYAKVKAQVETSIEKLNDVTSDLLFLVDADSKSFEPVLKAMKLPDGPVRDRHIDDALVTACDVPFEIMQKTLLVIDECDFVVDLCTKMTISDVGCGVMLAKSALICASLSVYENVKLFKSDELAKKYKLLADAMVEEGCQKADAVYGKAADHLDAYRLI